MPRLHDVRSVALNGAAAAWFRHVVSPLLHAPDQLQAAMLDGADAAAVRVHVPVRAAAQRGCFAGPAGRGCALSGDELLIAARVRGEPMSWEAAQ